MSSILDITETEEWIVRSTLKERYGQDMDLQFADAEIRLNPADRELTSCPVFLWESDTCQRRYRCQFFYRGYQQYGTGVHEYDDLTECTVSLLQTQADHSAEERGDIEHKRR